MKIIKPRSKTIYRNSRMLTIKNTKRIVPNFIKHLLKRLTAALNWDPYYKKSWSQEGEDQILQRIFEHKKSGFYVDVGAHHPKRFSNTYLFYKRGWRGINIDAMPGSMSAFIAARHNDINLEMGIGLENEQLDYHIFNEPALNGFSQHLSHERHCDPSNYKIKKVIKISIQPLSEVLKRHLPRGSKIDFLTVDVEGLDYEVLESNDWTDYRPCFVLAEILCSSLHDIERSPVGKLMNEKGYEIYAKCMNTVFFKDTHEQ